MSEQDILIDKVSEEALGQCSPLLLLMRTLRRCSVNYLIKSALYVVQNIRDDTGEGKQKGNRANRD